MKLEFLKKINRLIKLKTKFFVLTNIYTHHQQIIIDCDFENIPKNIEKKEIEKKVSSGQSGLINSEWFIKFYNPTARVIINGAVHITQTLAPMVKLCGFDVIVLDPRTIFASSSRFPNTQLINEWSPDYLKKKPFDNESAAIALTHDPKLDDPFLQSALKSNCFYIACLGSKKTHFNRINRLREMGCSDKDLNRIHGPAGLNINAKSPAEIAVSILAELIKIKRHKSEE